MTVDAKAALQLPNELPPARLVGWGQLVQPQVRPLPRPCPVFHGGPVHGWPIGSAPQLAFVDCWAELRD